MCVSFSLRFLFLPSSVAAVGMSAMGTSAGSARVGFEVFAALCDCAAVIVDFLFSAREAERIVPSIMYNASHADPSTGF